MPSEPVIQQLTKERDDLLRQIDKREKELAHFKERLSQRHLMPNQKAMLQAQSARQLTMLDADRDTLVNLEKLLAAEIAGGS